MKKLIFIIASFLSIASYAQVELDDELESNNLENQWGKNITLLNSGNLVSLNLEKFIKLKSKIHLAFTGGIGVGYNKLSAFSNGNNKAFILSLPHSATLLLGNKFHKVEFGMSGSIFGNRIYVYEPIIGYRYLGALKNDINLRVFITYPDLLTVDEHFKQWPFGFSFGKMF